MGYATIRHVQRIDEADHYAQAHRIWDTTKPIRGGDTNVKPLGQRRDAREYYCKKNMITGNVTYYYCGKPVITFAPNGDVTLCAHTGWAGHNQLTMRVLDIPAYVKNGKNVVELGGIKKVLGMEGMRLIKGEDGNWQTTDTSKLYGYKINRKKMAEVKAEYKEFERFFKGFLSVQKMDSPVVHMYERSFVAVPIHASTLVELFGETKDVPQPYVDMLKYREFMDKPHVNSRYVTPLGGLQYFNGAKAVAELMTSNQSEDTKQANFLKAAYLFCLKSITNSLYIGTDSNTRYAHINKTIKNFEDFILLKYTDKVTELVELPDGTLPNSKLAKMMTWHNQSDECEKLRKAYEGIY
jgi:hypothetical protein